MVEITTMSATIDITISVLSRSRPMLGRTRKFLKESVGMFS